jgi:CubicO group peptidase (beta-lactamase class C family)
VQETVSSGREAGLQVCVVGGDEVLFEAAAGVADTQTGRAVDQETLFPIFSATKGIVATAVHLQAERGLVDYDRPIADWWPEFGANGKGSATVRHALLHQVGIPQMPEGTTVEQMCDWEHMTAAVAALTPLWKPGTRMGYHAYTYGWILGEVVRRADPGRRSIGRFVREEIADAVGATDLWIGIPDRVEPRIARLEEGRAAVELPEDALIVRAIPPHLFTNQDVFGRPDVRRSEHPGAGGVANARSLARMYAMLAAGGLSGGRRLLAHDRVLAASAVSCHELDQVTGRTALRGLGYWIAGADTPSTSPFGNECTSFGHPGAGGSIGWADRRRGVGVAILKNLMLSPATVAENTLLPISDVIRACLDAAGDLRLGAL